MKLLTQFCPDDTTVLLVAISDKKFKVQRIRRPDGNVIAFPRSDYGAVPPSLKETSWQEHLQAIRDGRRTLLELETVNRYAYEMTADDGTKVLFQYGGNNPLKMPEEGHDQRSESEWRGAILADDGGVD